MRRILLIILLISVSVGEFFAQEKEKDLNRLNELREQLDELFESPEFSGSFWGVYIKSLRSGEVIYKRNENKYLIPASNVKLFTTSAGLLFLGSDYRYRTGLYSSGIIHDKKLKGDIVIRGSGDPTISGRFRDGNSTKILEEWTDTLIRRGITAITGNIIGDDNIYDDNGYGRGWEYDYLGNWYAAPSGALSFNDNSVKIVVTPNGLNMNARLETDPASSYFNILNDVITVEDGSGSAVTLSRETGTNLIILSGAVEEGDEKLSLFASVGNPTLYTVNVFKEVLEAENIAVSGFAEDIDHVTLNISYEEMLPLYIHESETLDIIIKEINKNSNNFYAEQLIKTLGYEINNFGSAANGIDAVRSLVGKMGINPDKLFLVDGSGLSRLNLVSAKQIVNLLGFMYKSNEFLSFYESLPIAGTDGTLSERMKKESAENNVRAKPGFLRGVNALSGYLTTPDGEPLAFSLILNNYYGPVGFANYTQDLACTRLANFRRN